MAHATCRLGLALAACLLASCADGPKDQPAPKVSGLNPDHWQRVKSEPPTYYPKGVPADHPTDQGDGYWVLTGDEAGTRYFVPARDKNARELLAEAMTAVTPEQRKAMNRSGGGADISGRKVAGGIGYGLFGLMLELDRAVRGSTGNTLMAPPDRR